MSNIFDEILLKGIRSGQVPARSKEARKWYRNRSRSASVSQQELTKMKGKGRRYNKIRMGDMVFFKYDAKMKGKLPYWDAFPLIIPFAETPKHFYGINLHYLPPRHRAALMDHLYKLSTDDRYDEKTKIMFTYQMLKKVSRAKYYKATVKMYLKSHVQSRFLKVDASEWDIALFLPVADFRGASQQKVWSDSKSVVKRKR
jgi:hypothetical protein